MSYCIDKQTHIIGNDENAVFRIDADYDLFGIDAKVYINEELLDRENYDVTEGSTIITLKNSYLNSLDNGAYYMKIVFSDNGEANTTFVIAKSETSPKTCDNILSSILL